jgi:FAD synthetase
MSAKEMDTQAAGPSQPAPRSWLRAIDNTYALFEEEQNRKQYQTLATKVKDAVRLCEEVIDELGINHSTLSFNGGKDCTVLVHILAAVLRRKKRRGTGDDKLECIPSLYITCTSPFQEVEDFVGESIRRYNLLLVRQRGSMKEALEKYLNGQGDEEGSAAGTGNATSQQQNGHHPHRHVKAIFVGTRRTDPHGADLTPRKQTDPGWPEVERIQPILDWSYQDVWSFLRCPLFAVNQDEIHDEKGNEWGQTYGVPYCSLYDEGYTSLGSTYNTFPNPILDTRKGEPIDERDRHKHRWLPAYRLEDESQERAGRGSKPQSS